MESLQKQVFTLNNKVDTLYQLIEQLSSKISEIVPDPSHKHSFDREPERVGYSLRRNSHSGYSRLDSVMEHKDVLVDGHFSEMNSANVEQELTPEIQIQRLTAQLTAAYNRIAVLEEQLLAHRIH